MTAISREKHLVLACALFFVASLILHARVLGFDFVGFDDTTVLLAHPNLYDETSLRSSLLEIFVNYFPREEPLLLRDVTWALDARVFGLANPFGYHLGNVILNAINVCLLFLFLFRATRRHVFAAVVAALFAVLPIHVEPVSWVMGRKDLLSAFFILSALLAQSAELATEQRHRRRAFYLCGLLFTAMALFSKMGAVSCFLVMGLHRVFYRDLDGSRPADQAFDLRGALREVLPRMLPHALLTGAVALWYGRILSAFGVTGWRGPGPADPEHLANVAWFAPLSLGQYLKQTFWPGQLSLYYRWPQVEIPLSAFEMIGSLLIALATAGALFYCCRRRRDLAFYLLAFLAFLAPYLNIVYVGIWRADRYVYLSSFCLLAVAVSLLLQLHARSGKLLRRGLALLVLGFGLGSALYTVQHQVVWRDNESLWRYEARRDEPSLLSIQALAKLLMKQAQAENDPARRAELVAESRREIDRGFQREKSLGRIPAPYATSEQLNLANLHYLLGRLEMIERGPIAKRIEHFEAAHALASTPANTLLLAGAYFDLAAESTSAEKAEHERLLHRSLDYFLEHVGYSRSDAHLHQQNLALLSQNYGQRFPFLQERIHQARLGQR